MGAVRVGSSAVPAILSQADWRVLLFLPVVIVAEQAVRAWKWRQLLWLLRRISTVYLLGAIMAGYLLATLIPFGFGTIARSWLIATLATRIRSHQW